MNIHLGANSSLAPHQGAACKLHAARTPLYFLGCFLDPGASWCFLHSTRLVALPRPLTHRSARLQPHHAPVILSCIDLRSHQQPSHRSRFQQHFRVGCQTSRAMEFPFGASFAAFPPPGLISGSFNNAEVI